MEKVQNSFLYIRQLRRVDFTVFAVADGQKKFRDARFGKEQPYASGQQIKRCIMETLVAELGQGLAPVEFRWKIDKKTNKSVEDVAIQTLDPSYPDQLFGGWMRASNEGTDEEKKDGVIKRRSPLSISAFRPLHPLLGKTVKESSGTFDRRGSDTSTVSLLDSSGKQMTKEELNEYILGAGRGITKSKFLDLGDRVNGLYIFDIAIDLRRLFAVSAEFTDPELNSRVRKLLPENGWTLGKNAFGECYICPAEKREAWAKALASAIINWEFGSNQARTYHPAEVLAVAISTSPHGIVNAIRAELDDEQSMEKAKPVIDKLSGAELFLAPIISGVIAGEQGDSMAINNAINQLQIAFLNYNY